MRIRVKFPVYSECELFNSSLQGEALNHICNILNISTCSFLNQLTLIILGNPLLRIGLN